MKEHAPMAESCKAWAYEYAGMYGWFVLPYQNINGNPVPKVSWAEASNDNEKLKQWFEQYIFRF